MITKNYMTYKISCIVDELTVHSVVWLQRVERLPTLTASPLPEWCSRSARRVEKAISPTAVAVARSDQTRCTATGSGAAAATI